MQDHPIVDIPKPGHLTHQSQSFVEMDDAQAVMQWLGFVSLRNSLTARSYKKEVVRFRIFLDTLYESDPRHDARYLLRDASEMDVALYENYLMGKDRSDDPVIPLFVPRHILARYGKTEQVFLEKDSTTNPLQLKASSVNLAMSVIHALYQHWMQPDPITKMAYVGANPVRRVKRKTVRAARQIDRNFPIEALQAMLTSAQNQSFHAKKDQGKVYERRRWIAAMLFGLWGRRAEMASLKMNDFVQDGTGHWKAKFKRKGGVKQSVPVAPWLMDEFVRYRKSIGMSALPTSDDDRACIQRLNTNRTCHDKSKSKSVDPDLIYREIGKLAIDAANALREGEIMPGLSPAERESIAAKLDSASPHWFRHSGATLAINSGAMSLENASKMLGHSTTNVTAAMYFHPDDREIEAGMEKIGSQLFGIQNE